MQACGDRRRVGYFLRSPVLDSCRAARAFRRACRQLYLHCDNALSDFDPKRPPVRARIERCRRFYQALPYILDLTRVVANECATRMGSGSPVMELRQLIADLASLLVELGRLVDAAGDTSEPRASGTRGGRGLMQTASSDVPTRRREYLDTPVAPRRLHVAGSMVGKVNPSLTWPVRTTRALGHRKIKA